METDEIIEAGKEVVSELARIIIRQMVDMIVGFIHSTDLTPEDKKRIHEALG